jgi:2-desacetyl-2-hydroxyethyl bacteriochlorophyllide A dehydrogenase
MKGQAVVFSGINKVNFRDVEIPDPQDDEILVNVEHSWISIGTEKSLLFGERTLKFPFVPGYQKVGIVRFAGKNVTDLKIGDKVFVSYSRITGMDGAGHINPAVVRADMAIKIPDDHPTLRYSPLVVAQVGLNAGTRPAINKGDIAIVIGDGLVAHWTAQTLLHRNAEVYVLGRYDEKMQQLPQSIHRINTRTNGNIESTFKDKEIAVVVDTIGSTQNILRFLPLMKRDSHWVNAGFFSKDYMFDLRELVEKEVTLHLANGRTPERMRATFDAISQNILQTENLITHRFPAEQAAKAWEAILDKQQLCLGVVLDW